MYIAIDPGINNTGVILFTLSSDKKFTVINSRLILNIRKFTIEEKLIIKKYGDRVPKLQSILNGVNEVYNSNKDLIKGIIIEAPFYSSFRPQTFGSIIEVITLIKYNIAYKLNIDFNLIEPLLIKKIFSTKGMATKELMKEVLEQKVKNNEIFVPFNVDILSEHEIDAIAVGYSHYILKFKGEESV